MAPRQLLHSLLSLLLLLLTSDCTYASSARRLSSRPLQDSSTSATTGGSSLAVDLRTAASFATGPSLTSTPLPLPAPPPWELELGPYLADMLPPRDPNTTHLRGPPRLARVFKGRWIRTAYGDSLRPHDMLSSEHGVIVVRLPTDQSPEGHPAGPGVAGAGGATQGGPGARQLPGGLQELQGELVIRDGDSVTDHDLRFRIRGTYVPAAGTVHAVLEPQLPLMLKGELGIGGGTGAGAQRRGRGKLPPPQQQQQGRLGEGTAAVAARWEVLGRGGKGEGVESSGYREALRTAARNLVFLGPAGHRTLVRASPSPPSPPRGRGGRADRRRQPSAAAGGGDSGGNGDDQPAEPPLPQPPPRPPLELALLQTCELRADFQVYYKGDPDARTHVQFLRLDQLPSPPSLLPPPATAAATAAQRRLDGSATIGGLPPVARIPALEAAAVRQLRHLAADTEIYHSAQMQLHADDGGAGGGGGGGGGAAAVGGGATAPAAAPDAVYGIQPGMDPLDPDLELVGVIMSPNCDFAVHFNASSVHLERYYRQALRYSLLVATVTITQIVLSVSQAEVASTPATAARMSLYSITIQAILDAYQCLLHLTGALVVDALFMAFASIAFLQFLLFAVFEMRQTLLVWRAQRANGTGAGGDFWTVRRDMSAVYFRFYGLLLLGLLLIFQFRSQLALLILTLHSWWLPQLVHSATSDTRPPYKMSYVWGMSALRLVSPLYFYGCPSNLLRVQTHPGVCVALVVWVVLQAALLTLQMRLGPRVLVPRALLPRRYDYNRPATKREMGIEEAITPSSATSSASSAPSLASPPHPAAAVAGAVTATSSWWHWVTLGRVRVPPLLLLRLSSWLPSTTTWLRRPSIFSVATAAAAAWQRVMADGCRRGGGGSGSGAAGHADGDVETGHASKECVICMNLVPLLPLNARMLTPCGHFFHEPCLTRWMEVKMDCPTCRRPLPPA